MSKPTQPRLPIKPLIRFQLNISSQSQGICFAKKKRLITRHQLTIGSLSTCELYVNPKLLDRHVKYQKAIRSLTFNPSYHALVQKRTKIVRENLKGLKGLREIHFNLKDCQEYEGYALRNISKGVRNLSLLKKFNLSFDFSRWFNGKSLLDATLASRYLPSLNNIKICGKRCYTLEDDGMREFTACLKRLNKLQAVDLHLTENLFGGKWLLSLTEALQNLQSLKGFGLSIGSPNITDEDFQSLHQGLKNLSFIQRLQLCSKYCSIGDQSLISLADTLQTTHLLKNLDLEIIYDMTDEGFISLSEGIGNHPYLQHLNLNFIRGNITQVTDKGLISLGESLERIESLKSFSLSLASKHLGDEGMNGLWRALARHSELSDLKLHFGRILEIIHSSVFTDKSFQNLIGSLKSFPRIKILMIKFNSCHGITDEGFVEFAQVISELKDLKEIDVMFDNCQKVSENGVKEADDALGSHNRIKHRGI